MFLHTSTSANAVVQLGTITNNTSDFFSNANITAIKNINNSSADSLVCFAAIDDFGFVCLFVCLNYLIIVGRPANHKPACLQCMAMLFRPLPIHRRTCVLPTVILEKPSKLSNNFCCTSVRHTDAPNFVEISSQVQPTHSGEMSRFWDLVLC